jgi:hypothetical protein
VADAINMPEHDRFQVIADHPAEGLVYDPSYLGINRTDDIVFIQITLNAGRTLDQKKALYAKESPSCSPRSRASGRKMCSSISSSARRRTGLSATASLHMHREAIRRCACSNSFSILNGSATARHQSMNCDWSSAKHLRGLARVSIVRLWANNRCSYLISSPMVAPIRSYLAAAGLDVAKA